MRQPDGGPSALVGTTLGLLAQSHPDRSSRDRASYEHAAPVLEAALIGATRDPALLPQLSAALGRLGQVPPAR